MKTRFLTLLGLTTAFFANSQTEVDLYRYSNTFNEGSARFEAMGGSFGALGAEMGSARINPAGFGRYSNGAFNFTLGNVSISSSTNFSGNVVKTNDNRIKLSSIGLVLTSDVSASRGGWLYQQFGVGYNGVANFTNTLKYSGTQQGSLLNGFAAQANGLDEAGLETYFPFSSDLAYWTFAINPNPDGSYSPLLAPGASTLQTRRIDSWGGIGELFFSYSGNYLNKLYVGANLGIQFLNYEEQMHHNEVVVDPQTALQSFDYYYNFKTKGNGTNLKLGAIYLPVESVRLGIAYHTPTFFELTDNFNADMSSTINDTMYKPVYGSPTGSYKYKLRTPSRLIGSFAYIFQEYGCFNVDLEYLDYRWAHFKSTRDATYPSYDYVVENEAADQRFTSAINLRFGAEVIVARNFFLRGGYALYQKGDKNLTNSGSKFDNAVSGGAGVRLNNWTLDASVRNLKQTSFYSAYPESNRADITTNSLYIVINAQVKF